MKKIIVTGSAGFIGSAIALKLLERGDIVFGIDNHNDYYDPKLKNDRLEQLSKYKNYSHFKIDLADADALGKVFQSSKPWGVINMAAQAGVRYSIENPDVYIESNIVGFSNILENCRTQEVQHLVYASSSSVYGANESIPFSIHNNVDHPLSLYAATKKSNELMAHVYSNLFKIPSTGLRFFTVYGPWGRPDMALFKFTRSILKGEKIKVFNFGDHLRDFTYISDIVEGVIRVLDKPAAPNQNWDAKSPDPGSSISPWRVYNIGNSSPVNLNDFIKEIEKALGIKAKIEYLPLQPGDLPDTFANVEDLVSDFDYKPSTTLKDGIENFVDWYKRYYKVN